MTQYRYLHYDVFTGTRFEGNPLAVLPDARGLTPRQMQTIAREMAFSETTFVLPPEQDGTDVRVRIFTPTRELPMACHPTVGTTFALVHEGLITRGQERFMCGLQVGPTPVDLVWEAGMLMSAWMTQRVPEFGATFEAPALREEIARAIGLEVTDLREDCPVQLVSSGVPFAFIPLRTREAVDRAEPADRSVTAPGTRPRAGPHLCVQHGAGNAGGDGLQPDVRAGPRHHGGSVDRWRYLPAGRLPSCVTGLVTSEQARAMVSLQGHAMGRPSWLHIEVHGAAGRIERVRVGGQSVLVAAGTLEA